MSRNTKYQKDSIDIHYDDARHHLSLACEPNAFETFRQVIREELRDLPEIPIEQVVTIEILDTEKYVARRDSPTNYAIALFVIAALFAVALPWGIGVGLIVTWLIGRFST